MSHELKQAQLRAALSRLGVPEWQIDMIVATPNDFFRDVVREQRIPSTAQLPRAPTVRVNGAPLVRDAGVRLDTTPQDAPAKGTGWVNPPAVDDWKPPGQRYVDQMLDAEDARWRAERKREFGQ